MADPQYDSLNLVGLHEPDFSVETDESGHKFKVPLPGMYRIGAMVGGQFVQIASVKAGNMVDSINEQKQGSSAPQPVSQGASSEDVSALATRVAALEAGHKADDGSGQQGGQPPSSDPPPQT
jgi:hypothetical protein